MFSILFLLLGSLWDLCGATPGAEEYYTFETRNGVLTLSPKAIEGLEIMAMPKQHKGALVDRKDLRERIGVFFEAYPTPYCYTNAATVEALRAFAQKSDEEIARYGNAYIAAIDASFDNMYKLQSAGKLARDLKCEEIFSEKEREGFRKYSYTIENPTHRDPPAAIYLEFMHGNNPWSSTILQMGLGENFPAPTTDNPISGRAAARAVAANVVFDMTSAKTTEERVREVMEKYKHAFAVIPIRNPYVAEEKLEKEYTVSTKAGLQQGCLMLPTKGQLIFQYPLNDEDGEKEPFCALMPTFGFVWSGPGYICQEEGGYDVGTFCNMLFGGLERRDTSAGLFMKSLKCEKVTNLQEAPQEGYERFLFWHTYFRGYGMCLLADEKEELPTKGQKKETVRLGVFLCNFMHPEYYEQDQAGPGKNYLIFQNVTPSSIEGQFDSNNEREFFIIERKTSYLPAEIYADTLRDPAQDTAEIFS